MLSEKGYSDETIKNILKYYKDQKVPISVKNQQEKQEKTSSTYHD